MTKELSKRIITAAVLIPLVLVFTLWKNTLPFAVGICALAILGNWELTSLLKKASQPVNTGVAMAGAILIAVALILQPCEGWLLFICVLAGLIFVCFLTKMFTENPTESVATYISANIFAALFFPFFFCFIWFLRNIDKGSFWIIFLFVAIWVSDSAAYFVGTRFGKHKIVPKISPKKSLEGFIGGIVIGTLAAFLIYFIFLREAGLAFWQVLIITVDVVVAGVLGDLFESMLKRDAGVKDSGSIFPGHGGILDRLDSLLFAAPVLYVYLRAWL